MVNKLIDYLNGVLPPEQEEEVQLWLAKNAHQEEVERILSAYFDGIADNSLTDSSSAYLALSRKMHFKSSRWNRWWTYMALSLAVFVATLLIGLPVAYKSGATAKFKEISQIQWNEVCVPYGQSKSIELSDGTSLDLRSGSRLVYPSTFVGNERKIFVEGEVYAKVSKNPECPFVISSHETEVKVYGTTFNFRAYGNHENVELMLFEGSLSISVNSDKLKKTEIMSPGQVAQYNRRTGRFEISRCSGDLYRDLCENNTLFYYNLSMKDIASDLEQRFNTDIIITSKELEEARIFAMFTNNESIDEILSAIGAGCKMKVRKTKDVIYLK